MKERENGIGGSIITLAGMSWIATRQRKFCLRRDLALPLTKLDLVIQALQESILNTLHFARLFSPYVGRYSKRRGIRVVSFYGFALQLVHERDLLLLAFV
jgi:hypothetical protein